MAASFTPTPLYPRYQERWDLSSAQISLAFAAYAFGVLAVLVTLGGLADRVGRLPALRWSGALLLVALAVLAAAPTFEVLVGGRLLQGLATGVATSAGGAMMAELHPRGRHAGSLRYTLALALGMAVGPLAAGLAASRLPGPLVAPYLLVGVVLAAATLALVAAPLPETRRPGQRLVGGVGVPRPLRGSFAAAAAAIAGTNVCLGVMGTFGPQVARSLGWTSAAAAGALVSLVLVTVAVAQVLGRGVPVRPALVACGLTGSGGWAVLLLGVVLESGPAAVAGCVLLGIGAGTGLLASSAHVGAIAPPDRRAGLQAAYLVVAFTILAASSLALGPVVSHASLETALAVALGLALLATAASAVLVARAVAPTPRSTRV